MRVMFLLLREGKEFTKRPQKPCNCGEEQHKKEKVALCYAEGQRPGERRERQLADGASASRPHTSGLFTVILQHAFLRTAANMAAAYLQRF